MNHFQKGHFLGNGTGSFVGEINQRISKFDILTRIHGHEIGDAHSFLLQNIFEHGIFGILFVSLFYYITLKFI